MRQRVFALLLLSGLTATTVRAGVSNPDISVIGQPQLRWTDDATDLARKRPVFDLGETEIVFDAALNPYARGMFILTFADGEAAVEEGYFTINRGLPGGLLLKGGKYRAGFGKLNLTHPHTYPFAERFGVLAAYLPGDESFNETGLDASWRLPVPGNTAITLNADVLQGDSFRRARDVSTAANDPLLTDPDEGDRTSEPRAAWLARLSAFVPAGDRSGIELGLSATEGTNNVAAATRTRIVGGDLKAKLWMNAASYLVVQGEYLQLDRDNAGWDEPTAAYARTNTKGSGGYLFADYNWAQRYNAGALFESYEDPGNALTRTNTFGAFAGLALMEESTAFRLDYRRTRADRAPLAADEPDPVQKLTLRVIFSMGPHKAHQF